MAIRQRSRGGNAREAQPSLAGARVADSSRGGDGAFLMKRDGVSRRDLLKGLAITVGGFVASGCDVARDGPKAPRLGEAKAAEAEELPLALRTVREFELPPNSLPALGFRASLADRK